VIGRRRSPWRGRVSFFRDWRYDREREEVRG
jgi:hypothetical protein